MTVVFGDRRAPVIVGAGVAQQRHDDPLRADEAGQLMCNALESAADDAGTRALLDAAEAILMPQGTWRYTNPAAIAAPWNPSIRSVVADLGVLQQSLLSRACSMVARGESDVVLIAGGEAKHRALRSQIVGVDAPESATPGAAHERMVPAHEIITAEEIARGLAVPARQYALIDTALRHADGMTPAQHVDELAALWSGFSSVAATNPHAWSPTRADRATLTTPSPANPMLAWPYTKLHCSQWNVDQAAGLIVCSAAAAERFGVARDRWVFAHIGVESNLMVPLTLRADLHRAPAVAVAGDALRSHCGLATDEFGHLDIYSCFPAAVRVQAAELGLDAARRLTVTGGMTFGGGPLNNYTLQAVAEMVRLLRCDPAARGLVTNVSGMLTKFGLSAWSCSPPGRPFVALDVTAAATAATSTARFDAAYGGPARALTYTVAFDRGAPVQGIVIGESPSGVRCLVTTTDPDTIGDMVANDWCGRDFVADAAAIVGHGR